MAIGEDEFIIIVTGMRFSFEHFGFYSPSRLVLHWMEELIMELLLVANIWCKNESWSFLHLLCSGPPPKVGEVLAFAVDQNQTHHYTANAKRTNIAFDTIHFPPTAAP